MPGEKHNYQYDHKDGGRTRKLKLSRQVFILSVLGLMVILAFECLNRFPVHISVTDSTLTIYTGENKISCSAVNDEY